MLKVSDFFDELKLRRDSQVADFGCGVGNDAKILSGLVPDGKIFAIDVHKDMLEHLETDILKEKKKQEKRNIEGRGDLDVDVSYQNIVPVWGDIEALEGTRLRDESVDSIIISNTFFMLSHKKTCLLEMKRVLKKNGKILLLDWHKHLGKSSLHKETLVDYEKVMEMFKEIGFQETTLVHKGNYNFVLLITKK